MSYSLVLPCGCRISVSPDLKTGVVHERVIDLPGPDCHRGGHQQGMRVYLWDMLPPRRLLDPPPRLSALE